PGLRRCDAPPERRQPVVAPPLVVQIRGRTSRGLDDPAVLEHAMQRAIERSGLELQLAVGEAGHFLQQAVPVTLLGGEREEDVELDGSQGHIGAQQLYAPRTECRRSQVEKGCRGGPACPPGADTWVGPYTGICTTV